MVEPAIRFLTPFSVRMCLKVVAFVSEMPYPALPAPAGFAAWFLAFFSRFAADARSLRRLLFLRRVVSIFECVDFADGIVVSGW